MPPSAGPRAPATLLAAALVAGCGAAPAAGLGLAHAGCLRVLAPAATTPAELVVDLVTP